MKYARRIFSLIVTLGIVGSGLFAFTHARQIQDWALLRNYQAPAAIAILADSTTMTSSARHIFYVNHPQIESDRNSFDSHCGDQEQTIILGCYHGDQRGIYIYDVTDARLHGVEEVTAAHEMLHAAYDRLSTDKRQEVDNMLQNYFDHDLHDQRIIDTINVYRKTEPNDVIDEMHSIFGTEVTTLPTALEDYYKQYFADRQKIASYSDAYQSEFTNRKAQVAADDQKLANMKQQIDGQNAVLEQKHQQIVGQRAQLEAEKATGHVDEYNAGVASFNVLVANYNNQVAALQQLIKDYNSLVEQRNAIALEEQSLVRALDSSAVPAATQ